MKSIAIVVVLYVIAFATGVQSNPPSPFGFVCTSDGVYGMILMSVACHIGCFIQLLAAVLGIKVTNSATCHNVARI